MKKNTQPQADVWSAADPTTESESAQTKSTQSTQSAALAFDLEGLMTDFPTARELEKFVYDQTGYALNLKGRSNRFKYQVALDTLNGIQPAEEVLTDENPYVDKNDLVPMEDLKVMPARDNSLPPESTLQNYFHSRFVPHPDPEYRANDRKCDVLFRKYDNGVITYEIQGPLEPKPIGEKIDKYGRTRPEIIRWVDPRTPETMIVRSDKSITPSGQRLRALMLSQKVWNRWIDREFISVDQSAIDNPWSE